MANEAQRARAQERYQRRRMDPAFVDECRAASRRWHEKKREARRQATKREARHLASSGEAEHRPHPSGVGSQCEHCGGQVVTFGDGTRCLQCARPGIGAEEAA